MGWVRSDKVRLFPRSKNIFFTNPVHEMVEESISRAKITIQPGHIPIHHYGKLDLEREMQKGEDYYLLGKMKYESDPTNVKYINELAKQAQVLHKYEEAIELWRKLLSFLEGRPASPAYQEMARVSYGEPVTEIYMQQAAAYLMLNRYEEALAAAQKVMEAKIKPKEYVHIYAHCEIIAGSLDRAHAALEKLLEEAPDYPPALLFKAVILTLAGEKQQAGELFQSLLQKRVQITPVLNKISAQLHAHQKRKEASLILQAMADYGIKNTETLNLIENLQKDNG